MPSAPSQPDLGECSKVVQSARGEGGETEVIQAPLTGLSWHEATAGEKTLARLAQLARHIHRMRARRVRYFPASAMSDAAWDILLALFADTIDGQPASTKSVGISGGVSVSSCLAILTRLEADGLVVRKRDQFDRRVTRVVLSPSGLLTMRDYLRAEAWNENNGKLDPSPPAARGKASPG